MCHRDRSQEVTVRTKYTSRTYNYSRCCVDDDDDHHEKHKTPTYGTYIYTRPSTPPADSGCCSCHCEPEPAPRSRCCRRRSSGRVGDSDRVIIEVRRRHEPSLNIRVSVQTRPEDVIAQLVTDQHRDEIVVHWRSGNSEPLKSNMEMDTLAHNARYLEIKTKTKTRCRWR